MRVITSVNRDHYPLAWMLGQTVLRWTGTPLVVYDLDGELASNGFLKSERATDLRELLSTRPNDGAFNAPRAAPAFAAHKPAAIQRALESDVAALYLDADMLVLGPLPSMEWNVSVALTIRKPDEFSNECAIDCFLNSGLLFFSGPVNDFLQSWRERAFDFASDQQALCRMLAEAGANPVRLANAARDVPQGRCGHTASLCGVTIEFCPVEIWNYYHDPLGVADVPATAHVVHFRSVLRRPKRLAWHQQWCAHLELEPWPGS